MVIGVAAVRVLDGAAPKPIPVSDGVADVAAAGADEAGVVMVEGAPKGGGGANVVVAVGGAPKPKPGEAVVAAGAAKPEPAPNGNPSDGVAAAAAVDEAGASPKPPNPPVAGAVALGGAERLKDVQKSAMVQLIEERQLTPTDGDSLKVQTEGRPNFATFGLSTLIMCK